MEGFPMASPTARTLAKLRRDGYSADVVERWIGPAGIRRDLFGVIDVVAVKAGSPVLGVQATSVGNVSHRLAKARTVEELETWLAAGAVFQVWGWAKRGNRWRVRIVELRGTGLETVELESGRERIGERFPDDA
jgi:hypothetical protein